MREQIHEVMELVVMQNLNITVNYFSTCKSENRERIQEAGKDSGEKISDCQVVFPLLLSGRLRAEQGNLQSRQWQEDNSSCNTQWQRTLRLILSMVWKLSLEPRVWC